MHLLMTAFVAVLFFALTPGILVTLPPKSSPVIVALTHALVFAVIYSLTHKAVYRFLYEEFSPFLAQYQAACSAATAAAAAAPNDRSLSNKKYQACGPPPTIGSV
jgi:hypothetical protein